MKLFEYSAVRVQLVQPGTGRNALQGEWQVQKYGGRYIKCWKSVSGHFTKDAAQKAAVRLARRMSVLDWDNAKAEEIQPWNT